MAKSTKKSSSVSSVSKSSTQNPPETNQTIEMVNTSSVAPAAAPAPTQVPIVVQAPLVANTSVPVASVVNDTLMVDQPVVKEAQSNVVENQTTAANPAVNGFQGKYETIMNRIKLTQSLLREINSDLVVLNREHHKTSRPIQKKKVMKKPDNSRSGITQEVGVSKELESFMGIKSGDRVSRTAVTRTVTEYIKNNNLQNPSNRRQIIMDAVLSKLLNPPTDEQVTYFNLQKFLKVHYVPNSHVASSAGSAPSASASVSASVAVPLA
jgi:chromatin remodeling complex protein RSC6